MGGTSSFLLNLRKRFWRLQESYFLSFSESLVWRTRGSLKARSSEAIVCERRLLWWLDLSDDPYSSFEWACLCFESIPIEHVCLVVIFQHLVRHQIWNTEEMTPNAGKRRQGPRHLPSSISSCLVNGLASLGTSTSQSYLSSCYDQSIEHSTGIEQGPPLNWSEAPRRDCRIAQETLTFLNLI